MFKNKVQIARETIKITLELPGPWTPAESEFGFALICACGHIIFCTPLNKNPGSAPENYVSALKHNL